MQTENDFGLTSNYDGSNHTKQYVNTHKIGIKSSGTKLARHQKGN